MYYHPYYPGPAYMQPMVPPPAVVTVDNSKPATVVSTIVAPTNEPAAQSVQLDTN